MIQLNKIDKPTKIYPEVIADGALDQFISAMEQPFATRGALMPDAHLGYSLPIGGVVETMRYVLPSWVGYDIGCGMSAIPTTYSAQEIEANAEGIFHAIMMSVPVGFNHHDYPLTYAASLNLDTCTSTMKGIFEEKNGGRQLGTLGGGNHFIEIGADETGRVWIIIHSGSRGVGHGCATHYMKLASGTGKASEGHFGFHSESDEGRDYIKDLNWCLDFALYNRTVMSYLVMASIKTVIRTGQHRLLTDEMINRNHNHAESKDGIHWIHRKGATHAEKGMMGVIPGNMRDGSFIVEGKGCEASLCSSSHGAGRVLGRAKAKKLLDLEDFQITMEGIVANVQAGTLDESPMAYKDIFTVLNEQEECMEIKYHVKPILNVKG